MKRNLVIGSEGFIGTPFCAYLERLGETVIRFDIKRGDREDARTAKLPLDSVDNVYFLAWDVGGSKYLYEPKLQKNQLDWNLALMKNVFDQLERSTKRFVFISSQLCEEVETVYGVTKKLGEVWTELLGGVSVRVWNAYGYMEGDDVKSHVMSDFIRQAIGTGKIRMMTDGAEWRQFTHISDLSRAFHMAANGSKLRRSIYDASSYEWVQVRDIARLVADMTGAAVIPGDRRGHDPAPAANMGRIPGWLPEISLEDGLRAMVDSAGNLKKSTTVK